MNRLQWVDALRGLAIVLMIVGNSIGALKIHVPSYEIRIAISLAAPLFFTLLGMMVAKATSHSKTKHWLYKRLALLLGTAIGVDVLIWQLVPFVSFDVLYTLAFATSVVWLVSRKSWTSQIVAMSGLMSAYLVLTRLFGYHANVTEWALLSTIPTGLNTLRQALIDGWFPLFPWTVFGVFGSLLYSQLSYLLSHKLKSSLGSLGLMGLGISAYLLSPTPFFSREGYIELFYPPSLAFVLCALGSIGLLIVGTHILFERSPIRFKLLQYLGQNPLVFYVAHLMALRLLVAKF